MPRPAPAGRTTWKRLRALFAGAPFRRLVATRVASQLGDGLFQLAAADLLLFKDPGRNPALKLTVLVAITLIPFSVVVPFVGVFIDRWDRRKLLTYTPAFRAALAALVPLTVIGRETSPAFFAITLVVLSANRLFLATISTVLPQTVGSDLLLANSAAATGGSIASVIGLGVGAASSALIGGSRTALVAGAAFCVAAALARTLPVHRRREPTSSTLTEDIRAVARELVDGARRVRGDRRVRFALAAVGLGQLGIGCMTSATSVVFIVRLGLGVGAISSLLGAVALGLGAGVVLVPLAARRVREEFIIPISFAIGACGVLVAATSLTRGRMTAGAVVVGLSYAFAKIPVDTIVQKQMPDSFRGRAFALYDLLFNLARVAGTAAAAALVEAGVGLARIVTGVGIGYVCASAVLSMWARTISDDAEATA